MARAIRGYLAALVAGNVAFWVAGLIRAAVSGTIEENSSVVGFLVVALFVFVVSVVTTVVPFAGFLGIAKALRIGTPLYFVACGAAMGPIVAGLTFGGRWREPALWIANATLWQNLMLAGAVGGWTYWRVGVPRPRQSQPASP